MDSQFDIVSAAIQDTLGESYDYRSIMHYGSSAFSKNGKNTIEAVEDEFTNVIGTASDLSELDVAKVESSPFLITLKMLYYRSINSTNVQDAIQRRFQKLSARKPCVMIGRMWLTERRISPALCRRPVMALRRHPQKVRSERRRRWIDHSSTWKSE